MNTNEGRSSVKSGYWVVLGLLLLMLAAGVASVIYGGAVESTTSSSSTIGAGVNVFGLVSTTGAGTYPVSINFTNLKTHASFSTTVSSGHFSIQLANQEDYNVTMNWEGNFTWQRGQVGAGRLSLNLSAGSHMGQSFNVIEPTPDSVVSVNGSVQWQAVTSKPVVVSFTASDGENFTAPVSAARTFSLRLPNLMGYEVNIQAQNSTGYKEWYYAHSLRVDAGVNVIGLLVRVSP